VALLEVSQLRQDIEPNEQEVEHPRRQEWSDEVDEVVVEPPRPINRERRSPGEQEHHQDDARVVEAGQADHSSQDDHGGCGNQARHGVAEQDPHDRGDDEGNPGDVERIANDPRPIAENQLLAREAAATYRRRLSDDFRHFNLRA
jgi:hypothetical protein